MKIRCIAVDDEPLALRQITGYLQKVPFFDVVGSCPSAVKAAQLLEETPVDVMFLDINMPDLNGLEFAHSMKERPMIVFTTAYSEFAVEGYDVDAVDYILKPFGLARIMTAANKVLSRYELLHKGEENESSDVLFVKADYKVVGLHMPQIRYVEAMSEYVRIYIDGQSTPIITLQRMKNIEERLASHNFMRIHRSYIVNLSRIAEVNKASVRVDNGAVLPIGDNYRDAVNKYVAGKSL